MTLLRVFCLLAMALALSACGSKFKTYNGPRVTQVTVDKSERRMYLLHHDKVLKSHKIRLGFAPEGHKQVEGDGRTPEGLYYIDRRNPNSKFHLSLGISYPNNVDRARARALGRSPGGDIFIHGGPPKDSPTDGKTDWTWGCIALTDRQMEWVYAMIEDGTPILITP